MLHKLRRRAEDEKGFTLIELLVVVLIIGILAAIAIPSFLGQRDKAKDAQAKSAARTAQTAMETCATDNNGDYTSCGSAALIAIEPTLDSTDNPLTAASGTASGYTVTVKNASTGHTFTITRDATTHQVSRTSSGGSW